MTKSIIEKQFEGTNFKVYFDTGHPRSFEMPGNEIVIRKDKTLGGIHFCGFPSNCGSLLMYNYYYAIINFTIDELEDIFRRLANSFNGVGGIITVLGSAAYNDEIRSIIEKLQFQPGTSYPNPTHPGQTQTIYSRPIVL